MKLHSTLSSKEEKAVSILCTLWLSKKDVTGPRRQLNIGTNTGSILAPLLALSSSQEPRGVVRKKVISKHHQDSVVLR